MTDKIEITGTSENIGELYRFCGVEFFKLDHSDFFNRPDTGPDVGVTVSRLIIPRKFQEPEGETFFAVVGDVLTKDKNGYIATTE